MLGSHNSLASASPRSRPLAFTHGSQRVRKSIAASPEVLYKRLDDGARRRRELEIGPLGYYSRCSPVSLLLEVLRLL